MPEEERIREPGKEALLLIATIEDLLRHEIALRETTQDGSYLVFPSQLTRDWEEAADPEGRTLVLTFDGPSMNIYATLVVRLSRCGLFTSHEMWRNATIYRTNKKEECGISLREFKDGHGELTVFYRSGFDLRLMSWGDGTGIPTSGKELIIVGIDYKNVLHIRVFDSSGNRFTDTDEMRRPPAHVQAISTLKQRFLGLLPPHMLTDDEKALVFGAVTSIAGQIYYRNNASKEIKFYFEEFIRNHVDQKAVANSLNIYRVVYCPNCNTPVPDQSLSIRLARGQTTISCASCDQIVGLIVPSGRATESRIDSLKEMSRQADNKRDRATNVSVVDGRMAIGDFDAFICYSSEDIQEVKGILRLLKDRGVSYWLDAEQIRPGMVVVTELEKVMQKIGKAIIFIGQSGIGPWQDMEYRAILNNFVNTKVNRKRKTSIIPAILESASVKGDKRKIEEERNRPIPPFLSIFSHVDFGDPGRDSLADLVWGIMEGSRRK